MAQVRECAETSSELISLLGEVTAALAGAEEYAGGLAVPLGEFVAHFTGALSRATHSALPPP